MSEEKKSNTIIYIVATLVVGYFIGSLTSESTAPSTNAYANNNTEYGTSKDDVQKSKDKGCEIVRKALDDYMKTKYPNTFTAPKAEMGYINCDIFIKNNMKIAQKINAKIAVKDADGVVISTETLMMFDNVEGGETMKVELSLMEAEKITRAEVKEIYFR